MTDAILLSHLPGQHKGLCIAPSTSSLPHLQAAGQTSLNEESTFSFSLISGPVPAARKMDISPRERAHSTFDHCFFRRPSYTFYSFLQKSTGPRNYWLNAKFLLNYLQLSFFWYDLQHKGSFRLKLKTSLLKTINIFVNSFVLPFNITRGNRTQQPQLIFLYKW